MPDAVGIACVHNDAEDAQTAAGAGVAAAAGARIWWGRRWRDPTRGQATQAGDEQVVEDVFLLI